MTATETPPLRSRSSVIGPRSSVIGACFQLTKPRITLMVVLTTLIGFIAAPGTVDLILLANTLLGTACVAAAASALNQIMERDADGRMQRTRKRPLPSGAIGVRRALAFAVILLAFGAFWLFWAATSLSAALAVFTCMAYVVVYTPLKQRTWHATVIGAVPGAVPPLIGWAAAAGSLDGRAIVLFLIMFAWQMPHFYAIAALYRDDYQRGGFKVLPVIEPDGVSTGRQAVAWAAATLLLSLVPAPAAMTAWWYLPAVTALGIWFMGYAIRFMRRPLEAGAARGLFRFSLLYLPAMFLLIIVA